ncbi:hypothetical protein EV207_11591 [Scopulibacillus darangshiensis]|uniref:Outer surface protein n=1 Tax=Scopulibacillus darangshiensis TaxID=442528 RepID=A0A4R2P506_9BACL|nr:MupG family TIM beta-alpha barrel fold protein [Scopulibacillus darangshiensis]TCP28855.1 hypothetical protein EV207_11591 [Scopulibacillus darangshiensis]
MDRKLGVSIFPHQSTYEKDINYLKRAHDYGFGRVFTCLLSVHGDKEAIIKELKDTILFAKGIGMEVIADISPRIFDELNISYKDLSFFKEIGADGIRLDLGYTGSEEAMMTFNKEDLSIEINMSNSTHYIDNIMDYRPRASKLMGCHNFYPHRYSGLAYDHFIACSERFKQYGLKTAAFVSSQAASFGPWPVTEGLPTLEEHRELPIAVQAKHLWATGLIDDVIIGNAYASDDELEQLSQLNREKFSFSAKLVDRLTELERKIVLEEPHFYRGDVSDYLIRSTQSRVKYRGHHFEPLNTRDINRGDILIENHLYGQYAGELQIALKPMKNSGKTNVVGQIAEDEVFLLDYLKPWDKFELTRTGG